MLPNDENSRIFYAQISQSGRRDYAVSIATGYGLEGRGLPQPGVTGPPIYTPKDQGGPVIPQGTGFPFCCLLRLAGRRWRYSNPPLH
jgi:hypothetical protein